LQEKVACAEGLHLTIRAKWHLPHPCTPYIPIDLSLPFLLDPLASRSLAVRHLRSQSTITHAQLRTVKPISVPRLKSPRIYRKSNECEHRQNDADPMPQVESHSHRGTEKAQLRFNANRFAETSSAILSLSHCLGYTFWKRSIYPLGKA
jgi:hypothetical protein